MGVVSDAMGGRRGCVIVVFLLILCPLLMIMALFADTLNTFTLMVMLACMGILIGEAEQHRDQCGRCRFGRAPRPFAGRRVP